nr:MAG TPA: hypothetical protein [Caudoviricetes sp.]
MIESLLDIVNKLTISTHGKYVVVTTEASRFNLCYDVDNGSKYGSFKRYIILNDVSRRIVYYALMTYLRMGIIEGVFEHDYPKN